MILPLITLQIITFLESIEKEGKTNLSRRDLIGDTAALPLADGLTCLAALPYQAWNLVPEPYSLLVDTSNSEKFEELYRSFFHPTTNVFDPEAFEKKCRVSCTLHSLSKVHPI